nr:3-oxo-Delta(4,5)-steroid 5-beta-reductase [Ipomoea batatas]
MGICIEPSYKTMAVKESEFIFEENLTCRNVAVIFGVTGLVGKEIARQLLMRSAWKVYGVARRPGKIPIQHPNFHFISCDLLDAEESRQKLCLLEDVSHVFWVTWASGFPLDSPECYEQNREMMANALDVVIPRSAGLKHVSLQTGTKHYISLTGPPAAEAEERDEGMRLYDECCPRVETGHNFYYVLEDLLKERLAGKVAWSIHRPGLIMGSSHSTLYNFMGSLCVYGSICKRLNLPFVFGGEKQCWEEMGLDGSDARLVAGQHIWAASNDTIYSTTGQALNAINGSSFTWKEIWPAIGLELGVTVPENPFSPDFTFSRAMAEQGQVWKDIVREEGLVETEMEDLANWGFLDALFRCPVKMLGTREKADRLGFTTRYNTLDSITYWIAVMREEKLIPW